MLSTTATRRPLPSQAVISTLKRYFLPFLPPTRKIWWDAFLCFVEAKSTHCDGLITSIRTRSKDFSADFRGVFTRFSGPFVIRCNNPSAGRLKLPRSTWVFYASQLRPKSSSSLVLLLNQYPQVTLAFSLKNECQINHFQLISFSNIMLNGLKTQDKFIHGVFSHLFLLLFWFLLFVCLIDEKKSAMIMDGIYHVIMLLRSVKIKKTCKCTDILTKWEKKQNIFMAGWEFNYSFINLFKAFLYP